jgi:hypothetical protein
MKDPLLRSLLPHLLRPLSSKLAFLLLEQKSASALRLSALQMSIRKRRVFLCLK